MVLIRGEISLNSPTALGKFRNRANSMNGCFFDIVLTKIIKPTQTAKSNNEGWVNNNSINLTKCHTSENTPQTDHEKREKREIPVVITEKSINKKLGRIVYTTRQGNIFEAYHSMVFPKIVYDGIVYDNKDNWRSAMSTIEVEPQRLD
jgi:hypothetical protein